jgi:hypothetical protein
MPKQKNVKVPFPSGSEEGLLVRNARGVRDMLSAACIESGLDKEGVENVMCGCHDLLKAGLEPFDGREA